ncbi:ABC transporter substrate-binding protein [Bifidobacterium sp. ESL0763]|uniref:ABC transporter substrate-binding protein n=1 Tax=Bifidobacterium sp. ESL0763 TaxID=2983227 RepID=UPI0023F990BF|nr:ABC transporter substrate-binding protein [Bifidobacterium sp. ESL0763]MDF7663590.1 ABC transporter substrate-binding protein [Bifidobacterium sp. ESL0763]
MSATSGLWGKAAKGALAGCCALAMLVTMGACGTTDANDKPAANTKGADLSQVKKDAKIAAMLPESVSKDGKFTVGVSPDFAPAEFLDTDGKTPIGYDMDFGKAISKVFGLKFEPVSAVFDSIMPSIGSKFDVGLSGFTVDPSRKDAGEFVSFLKEGSSYTVKKGNPKNVKVDDLCGHSVAVQSGVSQEQTVKKANQQCVAQGKKPIDIQSMKQQTSVTTAVATGKADAFCADTPIAGYAVKENGDALQLIGKSFDETTEAVVVPKGDMQTAKAVQAALQKLMDDGTYTKILKAWGNQTSAMSQARIETFDEGKQE